MYKRELESTRDLRPSKKTRSCTPPHKTTPKKPPPVKKRQKVEKSNGEEKQIRVWCIPEQVHLSRVRIQDTMYRGKKGFLERNLNWYINYFRSEPYFLYEHEDYNGIDWEIHYGPENNYYN
tara:strand:+ start:247 stop:609 length:363 start_codon:yes stop_codon:yes gene_type:complete